jgi:hypothetical protein
VKFCGDVRRFSTAAQAGYAREGSVLRDLLALHWALGRIGETHNSELQTN